MLQLRDVRASEIIAIYEHRLQTLQVIPLYHLQNTIDYIADLVILFFVQT